MFALHGNARAIAAIVAAMGLFVANDACRNTADAFVRAVQNLIGKVVRSPAFELFVR